LQHEFASIPIDRLFAVKQQIYATNFGQVDGIENSKYTLKNAIKKLKLAASQLETFKSKCNCPATLGKFPSNGKNTFHITGKYI
jgi:hypothetical protein